MAKTTPRVYCAAQLEQGAELTLDQTQSHYLQDVLRLKPGDPVNLFNGEQGEWLCYLTQAQKKAVSLRCEKKLSDVKPPPDVEYLFAPLKHARLDYMVQKATELGVRRLRPVITQRTIVDRVNLERMRANVIEAAEQCNLVYVPEVLEPLKLPQLFKDWQQNRTLIFCDETELSQSPLAVLKNISPPTAVLVGPEGGFTHEEKSLLHHLSFVHAISLGPRIMRADTAAIAALTLVMASSGDW